MGGKRFALAVLLAFAISGCSDDDDPPRDAGRCRAGARAGSSAGGNGGTGGTGGRCLSCGDNYNCAPYPMEGFPWPEGTQGDMPRRAGLDTLLEVLCDNECVPGQTLAEFAARLRCVETADDGGVEGLQDEFDGGLPAALWKRSEGCGSVQFSTVAPSSPRFFNFDADTGELIGYARFDDMETAILGRGSFGCASKGWIGGLVRGHCANETVSFCGVR